MSRVGKAPVQLDSAVEVTLTEHLVTVKGPLGTLSQVRHPLVGIEVVDKTIQFSALDSSREANAMSGTLRAIVNGMVQGVAKGFEKKLNLVGVGYKAQVQNNSLNLSLGFSHPVVYQLPAGIKAEAATPTEIIIKGANKQVVGQVAAEVRAFRPPEPYKGKGVRYSDERIVIKETKKK